MAEVPAVGGSAQAPGKKGISKIVVLAAIIVVIVVILAGVFIFIMKPSSRSPAATLREMVDSLNEGDHEDFYDTSVYKFSMTYDEFMTEMGEQFADAEYEFDIEQLEVITKDEFTDDQNDYIDDMLPEIEAEINTSVEDYCMIDVSLDWIMTYQGETETGTVDGMIICVKVDSKWYLVFPFADLYEEPSEAVPLVVMSKMYVTNGVKINVLDITNSDVEWSDVTVTLTDGTSYAMWEPQTADLDNGSVSTANYSTDELGDLTVCCKVVDLAGNGQIDGADYFELTTYDGDPPFSSAVTYTFMLVWEWDGSQMGSITFTG